MEHHAALPKPLVTVVLWRKCLSYEPARFGTLPFALHTWIAPSSKRQAGSFAVRNVPSRFTPRLHYTISNELEYCILHSLLSLQRLLKRQSAIECKNKMYDMSEYFIANGSDVYVLQKTTCVQKNIKAYVNKNTILYFYIHQYVYLYIDTSSYWKLL